MYLSLRRPRRPGPLPDPRPNLGRSLQRRGRPLVPADHRRPGPPRHPADPNRPPERRNRLWPGRPLCPHAIPLSSPTRSGIQGLVFVFSRRPRIECALLYLLPLSPFSRSGGISCRLLPVLSFSVVGAASNAVRPLCPRAIQWRYLPRNGHSERSEESHRPYKPVNACLWHHKRLFIAPPRPARVRGPSPSVILDISNRGSRARIFFHACSEPKRTYLMKIVNARSTITKTYFLEPSMKAFTLTKAALELPR